MDMTALRALMFRGGAGGGGGGGGSGMELVKTVTFDKKLIADNLINALPAYSGNETTVLSSSNVDTYTGDADSDFYICERAILIPEYNTDTKAAGREEYSFSVGIYQISTLPQKSFKAIVDSTITMPPNNQNILSPSSEYTDVVHFSGSTAISHGKNDGFGLYATLQEPTKHYSTHVITLKSPLYKFRGSPSILSQTFWEAITDVRLQYIIEVYKTPKNALAWGVSTQICSNIADCVASAGHTLT